MNDKILLSAWNTLIKRFDLDEKQISLFKKYLNFLKEWNRKFNLTAIKKDSDAVSYHFEDSLNLAKLVDCKDLKSIADVGSGGGFPGVPLKILYPHLKLVLIEVNGKKVRFLEKLVIELGLENVFVEKIDWRTFVRNADYTVDLFCARASLQVDELLRVFKPSSDYRNSKLVYWATESWKHDLDAEAFISKEHGYMVGDRKRRLILFKDSLVK
jgi:16S rRNA (guanine527-N7)-methyltransferase